LIFSIDLYGFISVSLWLIQEEEMSEIEKLREQMPDAARDIRLNFQSVFQSTTLTQAQTWGSALASAIATRNSELARAVLIEAQSKVDANVIEDARAAAALMAMNNVYYRFRHMVGKESYATKPARLRMNWIGKPMSNKTDFELFCLAVSAINGCEVCVRSHEQTVVANGVSEDQIHDAVRIAATIQAAAVSLEMNGLGAMISNVAV
jgi:lipoyl-dependent peroxiredoxin subunit D